MTYQLKRNSFLLIVLSLRLNLIINVCCMNYYHFIFRLNTDPRNTQRSWEGFANSFSDAIDALNTYASHLSDDLFSEIILLSKSEYLSVFK